jgi:hypothetical protein
MTPVVTYAPHRWESTAAWVIADSPFEPARVIGRQKLPAQRKGAPSEAPVTLDWIVGFTFEGPWGPALTDPTRSDEPLGGQVRLELSRILHDANDLAAQYREFALEDRALAEIGLEEYRRLLADADADER